MVNKSMENNSKLSFLEATTKEEISEEAIAEAIEEEETIEIIEVIEEIVAIEEIEEGLEVEMIALEEKEAAEEEDLKLVITVINKGILQDSAKNVNKLLI